VWTFDPSGGKYTWRTNTGGVLTATGVDVRSVEVFGTNPHDNTPVAITDGDLDFKSGAYDPLLSFPSAGVFVWDGPGSLTLTGSIPGVTAGIVTLVKDDFSSIEVVDNVVHIVGGQLTGTFPNTQFDSHFGIRAPFSSGLLNGDLGSVKTTGPNRKKANNAGGHITTNALSVPEDWSFFSTLGLFAFAMAIFGLARRLGLFKAVVF